MATDADSMVDSSEVTAVSPELAEVRAHADSLRREGAMPRRWFI
jgi:hypothetical protein